VIVADTSALVAIVLGEDDAEEYAERITRERTLVSAVSVLETGIVVETKQGPAATRDLELLLGRANIAVAPFDENHARVAIDAWRRFGKGRHPAALNFGDCAVYATARLANAPLLYKGNDFSQTDITAA